MCEDFNNIERCCSPGVSSTHTPRQNLTYKLDTDLNKIEQLQPHSVTLKVIIHF